MSKVKIVKVVQTSTACPSQWDMWDEDGVYYYVRYRYANFTVTKEHIGNIIIEEQIGEGYDGWMDTEIMFEVVSDTFDFSQVDEIGSPEWQKKGEMFG